MHERAAKKRGCLFYGCLTLAVGGVLAIILLYVGGRYALGTARNWAAQYTDTSPTPPPELHLTDADLAALRQRVGAFRAGLDQPTNAMELVLSTDEINALLLDHGANRTNAPRVFVKIDDDQLKGTVSIPLSDIGPLKLQGRYLNGLATLNVQLTNSLLTVRIRDLAVKGKSLPGIVLTELQKRNLAENIQNDPDSAKEIAKFESIAIRDGQLVLRTRGKE